MLLLACSPLGPVLWGPQDTGTSPQAHSLDSRHDAQVSRLQPDTEPGMPISQPVALVA